MRIIRTEGDIKLKLLSLTFSDLLCKSSLSALFRCLTPPRLLCPSAASSQRRWTPRSLPSLQTQHRETQRPKVQLPLIQENPEIFRNKYF